MCLGSKKLCQQTQADCSRWLCPSLPIECAYKTRTLKPLVPELKSHRIVPTQRADFHDVPSYLKASANNMVYRECAFNDRPNNLDTESSTSPKLGFLNALVQKAYIAPQALRAFVFYFLATRRPPGAAGGSCGDALPARFSQAR